MLMCLFAWCLPDSEPLRTSWSFLMIRLNTVVSTASHTSKPARLFWMAARKMLSESLDYSYLFIMAFSWCSSSGSGTCFTGEHKICIYCEKGRRINSRILGVKITFDICWPGMCLNRKRKMAFYSFWNCEPFNELHHVQALEHTYARAHARTRTPTQTRAHGRNQKHTHERVLLPLSQIWDVIFVVRESRSMRYRADIVMILCILVEPTNVGLLIWFVNSGNDVPMWRRGGSGPDVSLSLWPGWCSRACLFARSGHSIPTWRRGALSLICHILFEPTEVAICMLIAVCKCSIHLLSRPTLACEICLHKKGRLLQWCRGGLCIAVVMSRPMFACSFCLCWASKIFQRGIEAGLA